MARAGFFHRSPETDLGFTLIEVLVASLVLGVGLLGVATTQMVGLKNNNSAALRTQAVFLAQDIADRMRGNPGATSSYSLDPDSPPTCTSLCDPSSASGCSSTALATYDLCNWQDGVAEMPGGRAQLTQIDATDNIYLARIMWDDEKTGATGTDCDPDDPDDLVCFDLNFRHRP